MSKTEEERFLMCAEMYENAKALATITIPQGLSKSQKEEFIFQRIHGANPEEFINNEWLKIIYSGFWDYPFDFVVKFEDNIYLFRRGGFDEDMDDYPNDYEVILDNTIDISTLRNNFNICSNGTVVGRVSIRAIDFDPTHREQINSRVFSELLWP
jgi:hypothetical protein